MEYYAIDEKVERILKKYHEYTSEANVESLRGYSAFLEQSRKSGPKTNDNGTAEKVMSKNTKLTRLNNLQPLCVAMGDKSFKKISMADLDRINEIIDSRDIKDNTKSSYWIAIKLFLSYLGKAKVAKQIKIVVDRDRKLPDDLLTQDEIESIVAAAPQTRDKAFISVLYEAGARIGEITQMKYGEVSFDENGATLLLQNSKTGPRRIRLVWSVAVLRQWMAAHPTKKPSDPLWPRLDSSGLSLDYHGAWGVIRRACKKSGVDKHIHPHLFRHSRATHLARHLTEQELKTYLGWTPNSGMAGTYVHLTGKDIDPSILRMHGIDQGPAPRDMMKPQKCPRCGEFQAGKGDYCGRCGFPISAGAIAKMEDDRRKEQDELAEMRKQLKEMQMAIGLLQVISTADDTGLTDKMIADEPDERARKELRADKAKRVKVMNTHVTDSIRDEAASRS